MSMQPNDLVKPSKGKEVKEKLIASMTPAQREDYEVLVLEDTHGLTKVTVRAKLVTRSAGDVGGNE